MILKPEISEYMAEIGRKGGKAKSKLKRITGAKNLKKARKYIKRVKHPPSQKTPVDFKGDF